MKEQFNVGLYSIAMILILVIMSSYLTYSFTSPYVTIKSMGTITTILPLHVDGRYIKDSLGNIIMLRGVNKATFEDDPDGIWMGSTYWSDDNVKAELDAMKTWGINIVDLHIAVELWKYNIGPNSGHPSSPYCTISTREAIRRVIEFAAERGIYVQLGGYSVRSYWTGGNQDPMPFPPYQTSENATEVIASMEEFADFWQSIAAELKDYPSVLFELWNEPRGNFTDWMTAVQMCINAIREAGASQIVIVQWDYGPYCAMYEDANGNPVPRYGMTLSWIDEALNTYNLTDPTGNILFCTHGYGSEGATGLYTEPELREKWGSYYVWNYTHIKAAFEYYGVGNITQRMPLLWGEFGLRLGWRDSGDLAQHELEVIRFRNMLRLFHEYGIHYQAFWWRNTGIYRLLKSGEAWVPPPEESGQILIEALTSAR
jgi:hypothetical protein